MLRSRNALNALLLVAVVMCALSVVTSQHKARKLYVEMQKEKEQAQKMDVEWGQLQLEQSTWATPARVEKVAVQQLKMQLPKSGQVQFIKLNMPLPPIDALPPYAKGKSVATGLVETSEPSPQSFPASGRGGHSPISLREMGEKNYNGEKPQR